MNPSRMRKTVGGIALSFVLAVVIGISGVIAPGGGTALGASTTLTILGGEVQVSRNGGAFAPAADGAIIGPGDVIRTSADSRAVLTYFEGSTVSVEPSSELAIDEASSNPDGSTVVVMTQNLGRTWHVVTRLITGGSRYEVRTPAATASVRGTEFTVGVGRDAAGTLVAEFATTGGAVAVAALATAADPQPEPVVVRSGFQTTTTAGDRKPQTPTLAPEPERKVTVTVGSTDALVVDPLGRSNGFKDGKLVLQTPGAQVAKVDGKLVVTLPNIPDGKLATFVASAAERDEVGVSTVVEESGKAGVRVADTAKGGPDASVGLEISRKGAGVDAGPEVRAVKAEDVKELAPKVAEVQEEPAAARPGLGVFIPPTVRAAPRPLKAPEAVVEAKKPEERKSPDAKRSQGDAPSGGNVGQPPTTGSGTGGAAGGVPRNATQATGPGGTTGEQRGGFVPNLTLPVIPSRAGDAPKQEAPKQELPKVEAPKQEAPKQELPKVEAPKQEAPKQELPKVEAPKQEAPKLDAQRDVKSDSQREGKPEIERIAKPEVERDVRVRTAK